MSRARRRDNSTSSSLLPFLAVLLSTMGVLVVLLVVMASVQLNHAQSKHEQELARKTAELNSPEQQKLRKELEEANRKKAQGEALRDEAAKRLADADAKLGHVEADIRRRQDKLRMLVDKMRELESAREGVVDDAQMAEERLAYLKDRIEERRKEIDELKQQVASRSNSYAILPFDGDSGTRLQPIYIECRADAIVFQPEGIELRPEDMNDVLKESNPLAAGVRAVQRYYVQQGTSIDEKPYPIFIIRPDGAEAFHHAANALQFVNCQYGDEQVSEDQALDYSAANPKLAQVILRAVQNSKIRLEHIREHAPGGYQAGRKHSFSIAPSLVSRYESGTLPHNIEVRGGGGARNRIGIAQTSQIDGIEVASLAAAFRQAAATTGDESGSSARDSGPSQEAEGNGPVAASTQMGAPVEQATQAGTNGAPPGSPGTGSNKSEQPNTAAQASQQPETGSEPAGSRTGQPGPPRRNDFDGVIVERTLTVTVSGDEVVVGRGNGATRVRITEDFAYTAGEIHKAIKAQVVEWGIAGDGLAWKPTLKIEVKTGGDNFAKAIADIFSARGVTARISQAPTNRL